MAPASVKKEEPGCQKAARHGEEEEEASMGVVPSLNRSLPLKTDGNLI